MRRAFPILLLAGSIAGPGSGPARGAGGDLTQFLSELSEAATISERSQICADLDPAAVPPFVGYFCSGYEALVAQQDTVATRWIEDALALQPDFALGCIAYGEAYAEKRQWARAARWFSRAHEIAPQRLDAPYGLGRTWLERAATEGAPAYEKALEAFRVMTETAPKSPDGWANVGMVQARLGRYEDARKSYQRALAAGPKDPGPHHGLGSLAAMQGKDGEAEAAWKAALELDPTFAPAAIELAALLGRGGRIEEAYQVLTRTADATHVGADAGRVRRDLALLCLASGENGRALELLSEGKTLSPDARTIATYAHAQHLSGATGEARAALAEAAARDTSVAGLVRRAWAGAEAGHDASWATAQITEAFLMNWKFPPGGFQIPSTPSALPYDTPPNPIYRALASYPDAAGGIEGTVVVQVKVDKQGSVTDASVLSKGGNPALEWAALDAAKQWRFEPARLRGEPVEAEVSIPFRFTGDR
jgi:TonB family protein